MKLNVVVGKRSVLCEMVRRDDEGKYYFYVGGICRTAISFSDVNDEDEMFRVLCSSVSSAFEVGYGEGKKRGKDKGFNRGYDRGKDDGYNVGFRDGRKKGYDEGYDEGYDKGFDDGHDEGSLYIVT